MSLITHKIVVIEESQHSNKLHGYMCGAWRLEPVQTHTAVHGSSKSQVEANMSLTSITAPNFTVTVTGHVDKVLQELKAAYNAGTWVVFESALSEDEARTNTRPLRYAYHPKSCWSVQQKADRMRVVITNSAGNTHDVRAVFAQVFEQIKADTAAAAGGAPVSAASPAASE